MCCRPSHWNPLHKCKSNLEKAHNLGCRRGEDVLRASGLGYTVVRPGPLREEPGGYRALVFDQGNRISHAISCADVADVALKVGRQNHLTLKQPRLTQFLRSIGVAPSRSCSCADFFEAALKVCHNQNGSLLCSRAASFPRCPLQHHRKAAATAGCVLKQGSLLLQPSVDAALCSRHCMKRCWSLEATRPLQQLLLQTTRKLWRSCRRRCTTAPRATRPSRCAPRWRRSPGRRRTSWWRTSPIAPTTTSPPRS